MTLVTGWSGRGLKMFSASPKKNFFLVLLVRSSRLGYKKFFLQQFRQKLRLVEDENTRVIYRCPA
jgi:hypothetical protein